MSFLKSRQVLLLTWVCGLIFGLQILNLHSFVAAGVDHQAVVGTNDDDAAWNLAKTVKTRWWKDNGWVLYGPAYFRWNHTLQYFWQRSADPNPVSPHEQWERTAHHAILTTSLLAVAAVALMVASVLVTLWWMRFLLAFGLLSALLTNPVWSDFVLRAHPDHLFTFVAVAALYFTLRMFESPLDSHWRKLSAILWGVSVSVKMTLTLCTPGFVLLFVPPFTRKGWREGLKYLGVMLLAYFAIGFPQTIVLDRPFRALAEINGLSVAPTWSSAGHWIEVYWSQLWAPVLVLILAWACLGNGKSQMPRAGWRRVSAFVLLPFVILLGKNMLVPADHYAMPFVGMFLLWFANSLTRFCPPRLVRWPVRRAVLFFFQILLIFGSTPQALQAQLETRLKCREQAREVYGKILQFYDQGEKIWVDPYVPYLTSADKARIEQSWEKTWSGFDRGHWTVLAFNTSFRERFTKDAEPSAYTQADIPGWRPVREFYLAFKDGEVARTPNGQEFRKIFHNSCGHEIWQLQK